MYVQIKPDILQAFNFLIKEFEFEISTGKNDIIHIKIYVPKTDVDDDYVKDMFLSMKDRFEIEPELVYDKPATQKYKDHIAYMYKFKSERLKV